MRAERPWHMRPFRNGLVFLFMRNKAVRSFIKVVLKKTASTTIASHCLLYSEEMPVKRGIQIHCLLLCQSLV
jgi:hypothetical protein